MLSPELQRFINTGHFFQKPKRPYYLGHPNGGNHGESTGGGGFQKLTIWYNPKNHTVCGISSMRCTSMERATEIVAKRYNGKGWRTNGYRPNIVAAEYIDEYGSSQNII